MSEAIHQDPPDAGANDPDPVDETPEAEAVAEDATPTANPDELTPTQQARVMEVINHRDAQWKAHVVEQERARQPEPAPAPPAGESPDEIESEIAALYTDDATGHATRRSVEKHLSLLLKREGIDGSSGGLTREETAEIARAEAGIVREQLRSGLSVQSEISELVSEGAISEDESTLVQQAYTHALSAPENKEAANNPAALGWILKSTVYDLMKAGKIKPHSKPTRPTNPLQPGAPGSPADPPRASDDPSKSPFSAVRHMSKDKLAAARQTSKTNYDRAN
jgi:hypothetical protein